MKTSGKWSVRVPAVQQDSTEMAELHYLPPGAKDTVLADRGKTEDIRALCRGLLANNPDITRRMVKLLEIMNVPMRK